MKSVCICLCAGLLFAMGAPARAASAQRPQARIQQSVTCCEGDSVVFSGWGSTTPAGVIDTWIWDIDGDGEPDYVNETGEIGFKVRFPPDIYYIVLRVSDHTGARSAPDTALLHVTKPHCDTKLGPDTTVRVGQRVYFDPAFNCRCVRLSTFLWDLNDDGVYEYRSKRNARTSNVYYSPGTRRVVLKCISASGYSTTGMRTITVVPNISSENTTDIPASEISAETATHER